MKLFRSRSKALEQERKAAAQAKSKAEAEHEKALEKLADAVSFADTIRQMNTRNHFSESLTKAFQKERPI